MPTNGRNLQEMIKLIKKVLGVDKEIESLDSKLYQVEKALTNLEYKVADLDVIVTFLNEFRKNNDDKHK